MSAGALLPGPALPPLVDRPWLQRIARTLGGALPVGMLALFLLYPLAVIAWGSLHGNGQAGLDLDNYRRLWREPGIGQAAWHSVAMAAATTALVIAAALVLATTFKRSRVAGRAVIAGIMLLPMLAPSLMQGLGLIFLLGRNGLLHRLFGLETDIYGFTGLVLANALYTLPQATLIIGTAMERTDHRHYDAARTLGATPWRQFRDITLPQARYGLLAAALVVFSVSITDFGNAIVLGGPYRVLANEIYDQVAGQMDFNMGAAVGLILLVPALACVLVERATARAAGGPSEHARMGEVVVDTRRDWLLGIASAALALAVLAVFATVVYASLVKVWPYDLGLTLAHYRTDLPEGYAPILTSAKVACITALAGTLLVLLMAWTARRAGTALATVLHVLATLPAAIPGLVIGIAYLMAFNDGGLADWLYGSVFVVAACNLYHYHAQSYLMLSTGLRNVPRALEDAAASLGAGELRQLREVVLPFAAPALATVFFFLFMQSMVTLSAVVFLVTPDLSLASVAVMQLDANGFVSQAAAYATCIAASVALASLAMRLSLAMLARRSHPRSTAADVA